MSFWTDPKVDDDFTPEDKYFYLYLLTNPHTNICGCYEISMKQMERETGYNVDTVKRLIKRMETEHDIIRYDSKTKEVLLLNWHKYNWTKSQDLLKSVRKLAEDIKSDEFRGYIVNLSIGNTPTTPSQEGVETTVTVTVTDTVSVSDAVIEKKPSKFDEWWQHYPRKVGKEAARKAFAKVKVDTSILIEAVEKQKHSDQWTKNNGQYIPNPATWLNQGRWEDELQDIKTMKRTELHTNASDMERMRQTLKRIQNN